MVEIMAVLYSRVLNFDSSNPEWSDRDRFILSKGHGVLGYFAALHEAGLISEEVLSTFQTNESHLVAHPVMNMALGIESSNGSLGHGLSMGVGIALAARKKNKDFRTFVYMGDGECNEGSVWEAVMSASQLNLGNLTAIVDFNKLQSDGDSRQIIDLRDLAGKFQSFGWESREIDGHNIDEIVEALETPTNLEAPLAVIAHTVKGKGISFMENNNDWHHNRLTTKYYELASSEILANRAMDENRCV